jgi:hypothetical protein
MVLPGLPIGPALLRRSIRASIIIIITSAAYKEPVISVPSYLETYNLLEV